MDPIEQAVLGIARALVAGQDIPHVAGPWTLWTGDDEQVWLRDCHTGLELGRVSGSGVDGDLNMEGFLLKYERLVSLPPTDNEGDDLADIEAAKSEVDAFLREQGIQLAEEVVKGTLDTPQPIG